MRRRPCPSILAACTALCAVAIFVGAACSRRTTSSTANLPTTTIAAAGEGTQHPLWRLAPSDIQAGTVIREGVLERLHSAVRFGFTEVEGLPGGTAELRELRQALRELIPGLDLLAAGAEVEMGIDLRLAAAYFHTPRGGGMILPVRDPVRFATRLFGAPPRREVVEGRELYYVGEVLACARLEDHLACATDAALLAAMGSAPTSAEIGKRPAGLRGDLELYVASSLIAPNLGAIPLTDVGGAFGVIRLESGGLSASAELIGRPAGFLASLAGPPGRLSRHLPDRGASSIATANFGSLMTLAAAQIPDRETFAGLNLRRLIGTLDGEFAVWSQPGDRFRGEGRLGLTAATEWKPFLGRCVSPIPLQLAGSALRLKREGKDCVLRFSDVLGSWTIRLRVEGNEIVMMMVHDAPAAAPAPETLHVPTVVPRLADQRWFVALWMRGTLLTFPDQASLRALYGEADGPLTRWMSFAISESEFGIRVHDQGISAAIRVATLFDNPAPLIDALRPLIRRAVAGDPVENDVHELADRFPGTPFATAVASGSGALVQYVAQRIRRERRRAATQTAE